MLIVPIERGAGAHRAFDRPNKIAFPKRLLKNDRTMGERLRPQGITADEHVGHEPGLQDGRGTISIHEVHVDDHQVRPASEGGGYGAGLGSFNGTDLMAHRDEQIGKQHGDNGFVDEENTQRAGIGMFTAEIGVPEIASGSSPGKPTLTAAPPVTERSAMESVIVMRRRYGARPASVARSHK